jgi:glycosyltransferase involved in cell wall biosynthesis
MRVTGRLKARARGPVAAAARAYATATSRRIGEGVTVVTANFDAAECLDALYTAVRHYSPPEVQIIVVDNASRDDSAAWFRRHPDVRTLRLPVNVGHEAALDVGFRLARTDIVVAFDVDAFPIDHRWWDEIVLPIRDRRAVVSGVSVQPLADLGRAPYAHPCCLAMRRADFVDRHHSFRSQYPEWDTGERISQLEAGGLHLVDSVSVRGPGLVGMVFGGVVYHNFYGTRFKGNTREEIDWVERGESEQAWAEAVDRYIDPIRS